MCRKVIGISAAVLIAAGYSGAWFYSADKLEKNVERSVEKWKQKGYDVKYEDMKISGFPFSIKVSVKNLMISRTDHFKTWVDGEMNFTTTLLRPGSIGSVAGGEHHLEINKALFLKGQGFEIVNAAFDGSDAGVKYKQISGVALGLINGVDHKFSANDFSMQLTAMPEEKGEPVYDFKVQVNDLKTDPALGGKALGDTIKSFIIDAELVGKIEGETIFERIDSWSKRGGRIDMGRTAIVWGDLNLDINGTFMLDENSQPEAAMTAKVEDLDKLLKSLVTDHVINVGTAAAVKAGIEFFKVPDTKNKGSKTTEIQLNIKDGELTVGPIKLLRVPRLTLNK